MRAQFLWLFLMSSFGTSFQLVAERELIFVHVFPLNRLASQDGCHYMSGPLSVGCCTTPTNYSTKVNMTKSALHKYLTVNFLGKWLT